MQAKDYRADIDVLRAIAVLSVIFYHMHLPFFSGGYVGVSIFFVISGFLITGIIKRKLENNTFSFLEFYENRIRRILPALLFVIVTTILIYLFFGTNKNFYYLMRSVKRTILGLSNFFFYSNTDYFDPNAEQIPLLHTWSLGVEEQFYFIMPFLLFLLNKKRSNINKYIGILLLTSFFCSLLFLSYDEKLAFYMLPSRAWELLMGSLLAYTNWTPKTQKNKANCILLGLVLMFASIVLYGKNSYPGFWALLPCLGAVLYIAGGTNYTHTNKYNLIHLITNNKICVFIGVISYSLYLWHWTILVFYSYLKEFITETVTAKIILVSTIFLVSALSWKFVEQPFRKLPCFKNRRIIWTFAVSAILSLTYISSEMRQIKNIEFAHTSINYTKAEMTDFYNSQSDTPVDFIVIGDSHAKANINLIKKLAQNYHCRGVHSPLADLVNSFRQTQKGIQEAEKIKRLIAENSIKNGFVIMRLSEEYNGKEMYYNPKQEEIRYTYAPNPDLPHKQAFLQSLRDTVLLLKDNGVKNIFIQMPLPEPKSDIPEYAFYFNLFKNFNEKNFNIKFNESLNEYKARTKDVNELLHIIENEFPEVTLINPISPFLNEQKNHFVAIKNNTSYYYDDDHLSIEGAELLYPIYENAFKKIKEDKTAVPIHKSKNSSRNNLPD